MNKNCIPQIVLTARNAKFLEIVSEDAVKKIAWPVEVPGGTILNVVAHWSPKIVIANFSGKELLVPSDELR